MENNTSTENWDIIIKPRDSKFRLNLREIWEYRDLLSIYINRNITTVYKQTILGPLWFFIQPVFSTIMFMFVFGGIAGISTDGLPQPLFYMAGILCWNYFTDCLNVSSSTFSGNAAVFSKVYFPRLIVPLSGIISNLFKFGIQLLMFFSTYIYYVINGANISINSYALLSPILILMIAMIGFGLGIIISSMTVKYRDVGILISFAIGLAMYLTPIIYPLSIMEDRYSDWMWVIQLNPMTSIIETFRYALLGTGTFTWLSLLYSFTFTIIISLIGIRIFNKTERNFIDIV